MCGRKADAGSRNLAASHSDKAKATIRRLLSEKTLSREGVRRAGKGDAGRGPRLCRTERPRKLSKLQAEALSLACA